MIINDHADCVSHCLIMLNVLQLWDCLPLFFACMKLDTCTRAAADRDASPAWLSCLPSSLSLSLSNAHAKTRRHTKDLEFVTCGICSLSPNPTTNQVDNYASRVF